VDRLDEEVQKVVGKYEAEFLTAYRNHVKKVKEEIEEIKRRSINNANSEIAYQ
jgi:vacuolar-type H+-ATPase subunit E/Vma4